MERDTPAAVQETVIVLKSDQKELGHVWVLGLAFQRSPAADSILVQEGDDVMVIVLLQSKHMSSHNKRAYTLIGLGICEVK